MTARLFWTATDCPKAFPGALSFGDNCACSVQSAQTEFELKAQIDETSNAERNSEGVFIETFVYDPTLPDYILPVIAYFSFSDNAAQRKLSKTRFAAAASSRRANSLAA